jgi:hypothetical protein
MGPGNSPFFTHTENAWHESEQYAAASARDKRRGEITIPDSSDRRVMTVVRSIEPHPDPAGHQFDQTGRA